MSSVLISLAEGFEELEVVAVVDVLRRAGIETVVAGLAEGPVKASRGTVLVPDAALDAVMEREFDMIVLPGGMPGVKHLRADPRIRRLLERTRAAGRYTAAICAAPTLLADFGMLEGRQATSNPKFKDQVAVAFGVRYREDPVVVDGRLVTSRGPGTAMLFALQLVETLLGRAKRDEVEQGLVMPAA